MDDQLKEGEGGEGLLLYDPKEGALLSFSVEDGRVITMREDENGLSPYGKPTRKTRDPHKQLNKKIKEALSEGFLRITGYGDVVDKRPDGYLVSYRGMNLLIKREDAGEGGEGEPMTKKRFFFREDDLSPASIQVIASY